MKKNTLMILAIAASSMGLAACETASMGDVETGPPYTQSRTASYGKEATVYKSVAPKKKKADKVFKKAMSK